MLPPSRRGGGVRRREREGRSRLRGQGDHLVIQRRSELCRQRDVQGRDRLFLHPGGALQARPQELFRHKTAAFQGAEHAEGPLRVGCGKACARVLKRQDLRRLRFRGYGAGHPDHRAHRDRRRETHGRQGHGDFFHAARPEVPHPRRSCGKDQHQRRNGARHAHFCGSAARLFQVHTRCGACRAQHLHLRFPPPQQVCAGGGLHLRQRA